MKNIEKLVVRMRRQWVLEHTARRGLLILGLAVDVALACWLLGRFAALPPWSIAAVAGLAVVCLAALGLAAARRTPAPDVIAQLLDRRSGSEDLFSSALEFGRSRERYGPLGELTCQLAVDRATSANVRTEWSLGAKSKWLVIGSVAVVILAANGIMSMAPAQKAQPANVAAVEPPKRVLSGDAAPTPADKPTEAPTPLASAPAMIEDTTQPTSQPATDTVKITSEMIDKYLAAMPSDPVDMEGVTPIRWDEDEASGKNQPGEAKPGDKIDPVKLDASLLKDLQTAKKTKEEGGGKEGGVDIAVMSDKGTEAAKGKEGGKKSDESLANAVSKDPRGEARRLGIQMEKKGFQVISSARWPSKQRGDDRPMGMLDFLSAIEKLKTAKVDEGPAGSPNGNPADNVVRAETLPESAAALADSYFTQLRKADK